ncbi:glucosyltransferase domain-containing protein [Flavobacterium suzhouense]|uniref:Glucosyltransferase domain-containing protein n=1 Tax=Flavobacterium suzhouense TaxID=1529638 RepID=A0ABW5NMX2_9FLAO
MRIKELDSLLQDKKSLLITLGISLLYVFPILFADYEYLDDYGRNLFGYGWQHDGRFIATLLGKLCSLNSNNLSIYPFSLLLSTLILGFTGYILVSMAGIEKNKTVKWSSLLIITAPAFLGNLVYKFDCIPMSLSLSVVVLPYIFYNSRIKFVIASVIGVFLSLGLYQSSATVFFMVGSLFLIRELINGEWKRFFINSGIILGVFLAAYVAYTVALKLLGLNMSDRAALIITEPKLNEMLAYNNTRFLDRIDLMLRSGNYKYYVSFTILFAVLGLVSVVYSAKRNVKRLVALPLVLLVVAVNFWLISGVNMLLLKCNWDLRSYCGLGFFIVICVFFQAYLKGSILEKISRFSVVLLVFFSFVLCAQFGKCLTLQTQFQNDFIAETKPFLSDKSLKKVGMIGALTIAPKNYFSYSEFPLFENLIQTPISQHSAWVKEALNINSMLNDVSIEGSRVWVCKGEVVKESKFYIVRRIDASTLVFDFERNKCE